MQTTLIVVAAIAGIAFLLWKRKQPRTHPLADEDRPEIVVRNGRLRIRTAKDWQALSSSSGKRWKPDHPTGKSVAEYEVEVTNAKESRCDNTPQTGDQVRIVYEAESQSRTIKLVRVQSSGKHEPVVESDVDLEHETGDRQQLKIKLDPAGGITKVKVGSNQECTFPKDASQPVVVKVTMRY